MGRQFAEDLQNGHLFADGLGRPRQDVEDAAVEAATGGPADTQVGG